MVGLSAPLDDIEQRGLAGAIGADQGVNVPSGDVAGHILQCEVAAEAAAHAGDAEEGAHAGARAQGSAAIRPGARSP